jgi:hypothetical protein
VIHGKTFPHEGQDQMANPSLLDVNDSILIVIYIQPLFAKKENKSEESTPAKDV